MALRQASAEQRGSRGATAGTGLAGCDARFEVPRCFLSTLKAGFFSWARARLETPLLAGHPHRGMGSRQRLWMSITGSSSGEPSHEFGLWRREASWEGGLSHESQRSPAVSPPAACPPNACPLVAASRRLPTFAFVMSHDGGPELGARAERMPPSGRDETSSSAACQAAHRHQLRPG
jgi:hypothetical protein